MKFAGKHLFGIFLAIVLVAAFATGCAGNENQDTQQAAAKVKESLNQAADAVSSGISDAAAELKNNLQQQSGRLSTAIMARLQEVPAEAELKVNNQIGDIELKPSAGNEINAKAVVSTQDRSLHKAERKTILEQAAISTSVQGTTITVLVHPKDDPTQNLWSWAEQQYGFSDFNIDYVIEVPTSLTAFTLTNHVGNIQLTGIGGAFLLQNDVGNIEASKVWVSADSSLETDTGYIKLDITSLEGAKTLQAESQVGSVYVHLGKDVACNLNLSAKVGSITGAPKGESRINGGGPELSASSTIGSVVISQS